ncbi:transglycosylase domain-containing protein [Bacillus sp. Marseille-P3661]|uniref:transglycosylase domain-containing protein n=1 Tax=Bacillus sp. Marseille-P3661 TaxID=1936234 RepID=UPI000C84D8FC|nr:transglycosylase domain-containing protein [Bacillus sp. Marseille-P3661]
MELITEERIQKTWKWLRALFVIGMILLIFFLICAGTLFSYGIIKGPPPLTVPQTTIFFATDEETVIGESSHNGENRYWVPLSEISKEAIQATIAIEDRKFYEHFGFDIKRIIGAIIADIKAMAKVQGASTITQQYARNLFLEHDKTWNRKFQEALYTIRLETNYTKDQILEGYLNTIYYGHGAYGIEAAANHYFGKHAKDLTLSEATMLAGIPKAPSYYSPLKDERKAKTRQKIVLQSMLVNNAIPSEKVDTAFNTELTYVTNSNVEQKQLAPYFQDAVKQALKDVVKLDDRTIELGGLRVYTTLNPDIQKAAEEQVATIMNPESDIQTSVVVMEPTTGKVRALIGGRDYSESPYNRAIQAERMPGSTFKPFLYYAALENGFTPSTIMRSEPMSFTYDEGRAVYQPDNFNNYYANDFITMAQALALSDNIYAVKTHMFLGPEKLIETAKSLGISSELLPVPSLALGTSSVKMIDMVKGYSIIANGGKNVEPVYIEKVVDHTGEVIYEYEPQQQQILDPALSFVTAHLMTGMFDPSLNDYTSITGSSILSKLTRPYAGKSGTTTTDSWMIGFTPQLVTGVWIGYDRDQTIDKVAERTYAKRIWAGTMEESLKSEPALGFRPPKGVVPRYIDPKNGLLATNDCPNRRLAFYAEGTEPTEYCAVHIHDEEQTSHPNEIPVEDDGKEGFLEKLFKWW